MHFDLCKRDLLLLYMSKCDVFIIYLARHLLTACYVSDVVCTELQKYDICPCHSPHFKASIAFL